MKTFLSCSGIGIIGNDPTVFKFSENAIIRFNIAYTSNYKKEQVSWVTVEIYKNTKRKLRSLDRR